MTCYIVTKDEHGEDRVFAGVGADGQRTWTWQWDKMRGLGAALAIDLLRDFADERDARVTSGHPVLGPILRIGNDHKMYVFGWKGTV